MKRGLRCVLVVALVVAAVLGSIGGALGDRMQSGNLIVALGGDLVPHSLPRHGLAPISIKVKANFSTANQEPLPRLRRITLRIGNRGRLEDAGLPRCPAHEIQATTAGGAMEACGDSLVGHGHLRADLALPGQQPAPFHASFLVFNARSARGRHVILGSVHSQNPPVSFSLPFVLRRGSGAFGSTLTATIPRSAGKWARIKHFDMTIHRRYRYRGHSRSYMSAGCSVPKGFTGIVFPLVQATFEFAPEHRVTAAVVRACRALGGRRGSSNAH